MSIHTLNYLIAKVSAHIPLHTILIVTFVVQIVGGVELGGYLSLRNGQKVVNGLATHLRSEISDRAKRFTRI